MNYVSEKEYLNNKDEIKGYCNCQDIIADNAFCSCDQYEAYF